jgi:thiol:disulfide interchange protein DsbC
MRPAAGVCALFVALSPVLAMAEDDAAELEQVRSKVQETLEIDPEHVQPSPVKGWYTVRKGALVAYVSADGRYLLQGDLYDMDEEINVTELTRNEARLELLAEVPKEQMIVFAPEQTKHTIAVFTDIDCTYCRRFHSQIDQYLAEGIEVRYLLYPRNGPESQSWVKAEEVWCSSDRNEALTLAKLDREFPTKSCDATVVHSHFALGRDVGLRGTPAIVLEDGTLVSGYLPPTELSKALASLQ